MTWTGRIIALGICLTTLVVQAQEEQAPPTVVDGMNNARIGEILTKLELEAVGGDGRWRLVLEGRAVIVLTDESANRMRIITPVTAADALTEENLRRVMQANFDTALDARYAIAKGTLWSTFIHPLRSLDDEAFLKGLGQVVNLANTFGSSYSSGLLIFGGGDSRGIQEKELINHLIEKGLAI